MAIVNGLAMPDMSSASATGPVPSSNGSSPTDSLYEVPVETVNAMIQEIFAVGLTLASCARMATGPLAGRLATAIDHLDVILADLRRAAFRSYTERDAGPVALNEVDIGKTGLDEIIGRLTALGRHISDQAVTATAQGCSTIHLLDADHSLNRALIDLASEPRRDATSDRAAPGFLTALPTTALPESPTKPA